MYIHMYMYVHVCIMFYIGWKISTVMTMHNNSFVHRPYSQAFSFFFFTIARLLGRYVRIL